MAIARSEGSETTGGTAAYRWATWLFGFSVAQPVLVLLGWTLGIPILRGLGNPHYSIMPLASVLFFLVALGGLLAHREKRTAARIVIGVALALLSLQAFHYLAHFDLGLERLLFYRQVIELNVLNRGVPGTGAISMLMLDCAAMLLITSDAPLPRTWAALIASTGIGLTALTATMMLVEAPTQISPSFIGRSITTAIPNFALATAILLHVLHGRERREIGFEYRLFRRLSPAIIALPVFPSLLALVLVRDGGLGLNEAQFMVVACNILIVSLLLIVGLRGARQQNDVVRLRGEQLRAILAGVPDAVIVINREGLVTDFSQAAAALWLVPAGAQGCNMGSYLGERERTKLMAMLGREQPEFLLTGEGVRTDGTRFPLELRGAKFKGIDGITCFTLFARDLSEKLAAEKHVAKLSAQLAHVSRHNAMGELAADLAHELNQPLTAAINYLSAVGYLLGQQGDAGKAPEMVSQARGQVTRAGEIIRRMRDFAQHREVRKHLEPLRPMIDDAIQLVRAGSDSLDVEVELAIEPADVAVFVDRIQVQQVMVNLLRNAVEAIRSAEQAAGRIVIAAHPIAGDWVEVEFRDDGPGVPETILDQLFERFTSTKAGAGMGIGLSISRRIVEAHGGTMRAVNGEDGGATFCFTLPGALHAAH